MPLCTSIVGKNRRPNSLAQAVEEMDGALTRDVFLRRLRQNTASVKEAPSLANLRTGLPETSEAQLTLLREQRTRLRAAQLKAQLLADLQRCRVEYDDVLRANATDTDDAVETAQPSLPSRTLPHHPVSIMAAQPRADVDARRYATAPLLSLFHIFMRRQRVANRLACLEAQRVPLNQAERTATETEVACGVTGSGPFALLPPTDITGDSGTVSTSFDTALLPKVEMPNHHFISLRPLQALRTPLTFRQAHYRVEPFPEFSIDVHAESEKELDVYRSRHRTVAEIPSLQHFSQPVVTMETFAPTSTYSLGPVYGYNNKEYRPHVLSGENSHRHVDALRTRIKARTLAEAYLMPSSITTDANLSAVPEKLALACAEDSMSDDDEDYARQGCACKDNPAWLPSPTQMERLALADGALAQAMSPPSTFVSFLGKFS